MIDKCDTCGSTATIDNGSACAQCGCDREDLRSSDAATCSSLADFITEMKKGTLQQNIHGVWYDVNIEGMSIGYLLRGRNFRILKNSQANQPQV